MKITKIFTIEFFQVFLTVYVYSHTKMDKKIFGLPLTVFE
jgi:hypothetical protein